MVEFGKAQAAAERRQHERVEKRLAVFYTELEKLAQGPPDRGGELIDLGGGGLCFQTSETFPLGTQLVLTLQFPGWQEKAGKWIATKKEDDFGVLSVIGMVVWIAVSEGDPELFDIGVCFSGIVDDEFNL
jgi:hypothetical protein